MSWIVKPSYVDPGGGCNGYCKKLISSSCGCCQATVWQQRFCYQAEREANERISDKAINGVKALWKTACVA